ncbi:MAG: uridine phosphorylase [Firmicutes bacterium]|jgi:uridine phosphorylase|nr:uridine phosphorylase [Bacillota bacterium]
MKKLQHHIRCKEGDVARYVLLPGDPGRARLIAEHFDTAEKVAEFREYATYTGTVDGIGISVLSTGIGCPSAAIAVEELVKIGADTFIRVGTSGGMQEWVKPGSQVIGWGAIRDEGTSKHYMYPEFPAVADLTVTNALVEACKKRGEDYHVGILQSKDSFYGQHEPERMPVAGRLLERWKAWQMGGALASEMESAIIFILASIYRVRAGSICLCAGNQLLGPLSDEEKAKIRIETTIETAIEAVKILHEWDQKEQ